MQKRIKILLKDNIFLVAVCITIAIAYLSLIKTPFSQPEVANIDKWEHSFAYFVLTTCWLLAFYKEPERKYTIVIACIIYGIIIEILQYTLTIYRTGDYKDVLANTLGVVLALTIFNKIFKKNELINK